MSAIDISRLTPQERLDLIGELWDSLEAEAVPVPPAHLAELERRIAWADAHPDEFVPWEEVLAGLERLAPDE